MQKFHPAWRWIRARSPGPSAVVLALALLLGEAQAQAHDALILSSQAGDPYEQLAESAARHLAAARFAATRALMDQPGWQALVPAKQVLLAIGTRAYAALRAQDAARTVVGCGVLRPTEGPAVRLEHSHEVRARLVHAVLPGARALGLLRGQGAAPADRAAFHRATDESGLRLLVREVLPGATGDEALASLAGRVDVLTVTYDLDISNPSASNRVRLYGYQNRIPVFGLSEAWARAGALVSLDWDWEDLGRQCADMAVRVARSPESRHPEIEHPRATPYVISRRAAAFFRIALKPEFVRGARRVYD